MKLFEGWGGIPKFLSLEASGSEYFALGRTK
jgi:hypothetical protein